MSNVSVILPTYNRDEILPRAIDSVLEQTHNHFDLIIVDDGSTDGTQELVESYTDSRIRYLRQKNRGANAARNYGIEAAETDFIAFLDSDDEYSPTFLEQTTSKLSNLSERFAGVCTAFVRVGTDGSESIKPIPAGEISPIDIQNSNVIGGFSGTLFRRELFDKIGHLNTSLPQAQDIEFYLRVARAEFSIYGINEPLCWYHKHGEQITRDANRVIQGQTAILDEFDDDITDSHRAQRHDKIGMAYAHLGDMTGARSNFAAALRLDNSRWEYWYHLLLSFMGKRIFERATLHTEFE